MPTVTKEELIEQIEALGVVAPKSFGVRQLRSLLSETRASIDVPKTLTLKNMISQLNKAAKCKASLQEFATSHDVVFTANMTMDQIYGRVEQKLTLMVPPTTTDKVNFGEYANLEYGQLLEDHPQYASWVQKTAKEGDCNWRLARLASWLNEGPPAPRHQKKLVTKGGKGRGKSSQQQADDSSNASWGKVSQASSSELSALKEELDRLRSENAELTLQMERNKSRKEM